MKMAKFTGEMSSFVTAVHVVRYRHFCINLWRMVSTDDYNYCNSTEIVLV